MYKEESGVCRVWFWICSDIFISGIYLEKELCKNKTVDVIVIDNLYIYLLRKERVRKLELCKELRSNWCIMNCLFIYHYLVIIFIYLFLLFLAVIFLPQLSSFRSIHFMKLFSLLIQCTRYNTLFFSLEVKCSPSEAKLKKILTVDWKKASVHNSINLLILFFFFIMFVCVCV